MEDGDPGSAREGSGGQSAKPQSRMDMDMEYYIIN